MNRDTSIRVGLFAAMLLAMAAWEALAPRRPSAVPRAWRTANNLGVFVVGALLVRLAFPAAAVGAALAASARGWGLLNSAAVPPAVGFVTTIVVLDLVVWGQHLALHRVPWLWRLHRMHHSDTGVDVTTGLRFHPLELLLSMGIKCAAVIALGAPPAAVLVFEALLNATSLFNHGNVRLPPGIDRWLRLLVVTPDMHRIHHSWHPDETNANFGFNLPWWDRLCGTYKEWPRDGHAGMTLGLHEFRTPAESRIDRLLAQPFA